MRSMGTLYLMILALEHMGIPRVMDMVMVVAESTMRISLQLPLRQGITKSAIWNH